MGFAEFLNLLDEIKYADKHSSNFKARCLELHAMLQSINNLESLFFWIKKSESLGDREILSREKWAPLDPEDVFSLIYDRLPSSQDSKREFIESLHNQYRDKGHLSDKQMLHLMKTYWMVHG